MTFSKSLLVLFCSALSFGEIVAANPVAKSSPSAKRSTPQNSNGFKVSEKKQLKATHAPSPDVVTDTHAVLRRSTGKSRSFGYLASLQAGKHSRGVYEYGSAPLTLVDEGTAYDVQIQFADNPPVSVILDTGSSDTWLAQSGYQCVDSSGTAESEAECDFGPLFDGTFEEGQISNENFNIGYGDGEFLTGVLGFEDVTIANITVTRQEVALVNFAFWLGDGETSGLLGLAYPALTSAYSGTDPSQDTAGDNIEYNPIFTTMVNESLVAPTFSLALERAPSSGGYIAFGGLPPISFDQTFTSTPIEILDLVDDATAATQYTFYTITPDGFTISGTQSSRYSHRSFPHQIQVTSDFPIIVDSGTTLVYLPDELADAVNAMFDPPAQFLEDEGGFFVACNAAAPQFGVVINGTTFNVNAADLIFQTQQDPTTGLCLTGVQEGGEGPFILGDVFLQNVVAVFDVGAAELRFAAHENY